MNLAFVIEAMSVAALAGFSYGSTNLDNLVMLSAYSVKPGYRSSLVRLTFVAVCPIVLLISFLLARVADDHFLAQQLNYLGAIPLALGLWQLLQLVLGRAGDEAPEDSPPLGSKTIKTGFAAYVTLALVLLANSGDTIGVMTSLLADLRPSLAPASFAAAVTVAVVMSWLAKFLARHPATRAHVERIAKWALPFLLIGIGLVILTEQPSGVFI